MSDGIILQGTVHESADSRSFWGKILVRSQGIRSGWRLTIFLFILSFLVIGTRIPAAVRIFNQGFLSPVLNI